MLEVKGERTPEVVEALRSAYPHRCTRVDACIDFERPGAFEALLEPVLRAKRDFDLYGERRGDWEKPELGRTMYLGSPSSAIRARLYEKGKQPEFRWQERFDLARLEIQVRPLKDAREHFATVKAVDVWGASKWTRQLAAEVLEQHLDAHPPGTIRKLANRDKAVRWLCRQYGPHLVSLADDLGGWDMLGLTLRETVSEEKRAQEVERRLRARS
jgi:DNA relaxase NicK